MLLSSSLPLPVSLPILIFQSVTLNSSLSSVQFFSVIFSRQDATHRHCREERGRGKVWLAERPNQDKQQDAIGVHLAPCHRGSKMNDIFIGLHPRQNGKFLAPFARSTDSPVSCCRRGTLFPNVQRSFFPLARRLSLLT